MTQQGCPSQTERDKCTLCVPAALQRVLCTAKGRVSVDKVVHKLSDDILPLAMAAISKNDHTLPQKRLTHDVSTCIGEGTSTFCV